AGRLGRKVENRVERVVAFNRDVHRVAPVNLLYSTRDYAKRRQVSILGGNYGGGKPDCRVAQVGSAWATQPSSRCREAYFVSSFLSILSAFFLLLDFLVFFSFFVSSFLGASCANDTVAI